MLRMRLTVPLLRCAMQSYNVILLSILRTFLKLPPSWSLKSTLAMILSGTLVFQEGTQVPMYMRATRR